MPDSRSASRHLLRAAILLSVVFAAASNARGQDKRDLITIEDAIWGFDGRVQVGQFNPVSFLIDNRTDDAIDATASLSRYSGLVSSSGGRILQTVYIGPGARRWVQFYPWIESDDQADWQLTIDDLRFDRQPQARSTMTRDNVRDRKQPAPAAVILDAPGFLNRSPVTVKHFPENIFPPWATATIGLHTVFMDHVPDWEIPRQEAFLSWLRQGGRLHLLKNAQGNWPPLSGVLAELNQPLTRFSVGSGTVQKHDLQRADVTEVFVKATIQPDTGGDPDAELEDITAETRARADQYGYQDNAFGMESSDWLDSNWFEKMRELTQPEHSWGLIFLLALLYIGLIFPGCWLLSRKSRSFVQVYGSIVGLSIVFSLLFLMIGRRGYGEATTLHTLAVSRVGDSAEQSMLQWNALFVTQGDEYSVRAPEQQALFAIPGLRERSNARMTEGNAGELTVAIPPFSTQTFVNRRQLPVRDWGLELQTLEAGAGGLKQLVLRCGRDFPKSDSTVLRALYGRKVYRLRHDSAGGLITLIAATGSLAAFCQDYRTDAYQNYGWAYYAPEDADQFYREAMPGLVIRSLMDEGVEDPQSFRLPPDRARLFVYTELSPAEQIEVSVEAARFGRVLYVRDLFADSVIPERNGEVGRDAQASDPAESPVDEFPGESSRPELTDP